MPKARGKFMNNDELYEVEDMDEDIKQKKELIEEAKNLEDSGDWNSMSRKINELQRRFRRIHYWESDYEDSLKEEFDACLDKFYDKKHELDSKNEQIKEDLITKAKELASSENWKEATQQMTDLMTQWKEVPRMGREKDDALWERFNEARQTFYARKHDHWQDLNEQFAKAKEVKEDLIEKAKALQDFEEWQKASKQFKDLMTQWKQAGNAGREFEDDLWEKFNEARQHFYQKRNVFYDELHAKQAESYDAKLKLIDQAKEVEAKKEYTREDTQTMKDFGVKWKEIGSCGKDKENEIWNTFRSVMDDYFDGLKQKNDQKHEEWKGRMEEARSRKQELIDNQKRQIERLQEDLQGLVSQSRVDEIEDTIAGKEEFIEQLENEIKDIESKLED